MLCICNEAIAMAKSKCNLKQNAIFDFNKDTCYVLFSASSKCNIEVTTKNTIKTNSNPNLIKSNGISTCKTLDNFNLGFIFQPNKVVLIGIGADF